MNDTRLMVLVILICIALIVVAPIISIWALNTLLVGALFAAEIPLNIYTYLAMMWCGGLFGAVAKAATGK